MDQRIRFCSGANGRPIAYAIAGVGTPILCAAWWVSHLEHDWANPRFRAFFSSLARHHMLVRYDRGGVGLSDRTRTAFSLESEIADFEAVVAEVGAPRFAVFAQSAGAPIAIAFAAAHPERVTRLVLYGSYARGSLLAPPEIRSAMPTLVRASWGLGSKILADIFAPGCAPDELEQVASFQRVACSAEMASRLLALTYGIDVADQARRITTPALVLHRRGDRAIRFEAGRDLAALIPGAELVVLDGDMHIPWLGDSAAIVNAIAQFLGDAVDTGEEEPRAAAAPDREASPPTRGSFLRRGEVWEVTFAGRTVHLKHGKGLGDLAYLLGRPGTDVAAAELAYADAPDGVPEGATSPVLDLRALAAYRQRLSELDAELERAEAWHDAGQRERLLADRELLVEELQRTTRQGGRSRSFPDERERARKAVSARIRQSIAALRSVHPELGEHLERSVTTGTRCRYGPTPTVSWRT